MLRLLRLGSIGEDVKELQALLNIVLPTPRPILDTDGIFGPLTQGRVQGFQRLAQISSDGIVGPQTRSQLLSFSGGATTPPTNGGPTIPPASGGPIIPPFGPPLGTTHPDFVGFDDDQIETILFDLTVAQSMIEVVMAALTTLPEFIQKTSQALFNVFDIDLSIPDGTNPPAQAQEKIKLMQLTRGFQVLRMGLQKPFQKVFDPGTSDLENMAFVIGTGPTAFPMHFTDKYFELERSYVERAGTIIHELAHVLIQPPNDETHPGMANGQHCIIPDRDQSTRFRGGRPFFDFAIRNPFCYEWLTYALQPNYFALMLYDEAA
jgi:peptidoglycan hydrolase-like protein with peptidoglycan-binding domain